MKINRLETHDRLEHFVNQDFDIGKSCQNLIDQRPFGEYPFYIFAHKREIGLDERMSMFNQDLMQPFDQRRFFSLDQVPNARIIWQPRLTKPKAQTNSMLFKAYPGSDNLKVIWMLPAPELWDQYTKGKMLENKTVCESIFDYKNNKNKLEMPEDDDLSDDQIDKIYKELSREAKGGNFKLLLG